MYDTVENSKAEIFLFCMLSVHNTRIVIPTSVETIANNAFWGCNSLISVFYTGTAEQWNIIDKSAGNTFPHSVPIQYVMNYTVPMGDANGDGEVNSLDAAFILKYDVGILSGVDFAYSDFNLDGKVDSLDAAQILRYDAGISNAGTCNNVMAT